MVGITDNWTISVSNPALAGHTTMSQAQLASESYLATNEGDILFEISVMPFEIPHKI